MKYSLRTEHLELTDLDKEQLDKKIDRLTKHLVPPFMTDITISHDQHHRKGQVITCIINIGQGKKVFHAERSAESVQNALDLVLEALERELEKEHTKRKNNHE